MGAEVHGLDRGLRLLAWRIWATAPLGQARSAPPSLSAMPVILPYIAPFLLLLKTNTKANKEAADPWVRVEAPSRTKVWPEIAPGTTP